MKQLTSLRILAAALAIMTLPSCSTPTKAVAKTSKTQPRIAAQPDRYFNAQTGDWDWSRD